MNRHRALFLRIEGSSTKILSRTYGKTCSLEDFQFGILGISFFPPKGLSPTFGEDYLKQGHFMNKTQIESPGGSVTL
jgi:hypothetical protein